MSIAIVMLLVCLVLGIIFLSTLAYLKSTRIFDKKLLLYLVGSTLLFCALGAVAGRFESVIQAYLLLEVAAFLLGLAVFKLHLSAFEWADRNDFWPSMLFLLTLLFFGAAGLSGFFQWMSKDATTFFPELLTGLIPFLLPYIFMKSFDYWELIPPKIYQKWYFPLRQPVPIVEFRDTIALNFRVTKRPDIPDLSAYTVKAPQEKRLGELYHYMIVSHNTEKDPERPIAFKDNSIDEKPLGWIFYTESFFGLIKHYFESDKTLKENQLKNNDTVIARSFTD